MRWFQWSIQLQVKIFRKLKHGYSVLRQRRRYCKSVLSRRRRLWLGTCHPSGWLSENSTLKQQLSSGFFQHSILNSPALRKEKEQDQFLSGTRRSWAVHHGNLHFKSKWQKEKVRNIGYWCLPLFLLFLQVAGIDVNIQSTVTPFWKRYNNPSQRGAKPMHEASFRPLKEGLGERILSKSYHQRTSGHRRFVNAKIQITDGLDAANKERAEKIRATCLHYLPRPTLCAATCSKIL